MEKVNQQQVTSVVTDGQNSRRDLSLAQITDIRELEIKGVTTLIWHDA